MRALSEGTSVNALVRDHLARYAGVGGGLDAFLVASATLDASSGPSGRSRRRDDIHRDRDGASSFADERT